MEIFFLHGELPRVDASDFHPDASLVEDLKQERDSIEYDVDAAGTAHIPIKGPIFASVPLVLTYLGVQATGTWNLRKKVQAAAADPDVKSIQYHVDGPGGTTLGLTEAAAAIRESGKPSSAHVQNGAYSAQYFLASQADEVTASSSAQLGSLGTYITVRDSSTLFEQMGEKVHVLSSGGVKGIGVEGTEFTETQRTFLQKKVNEATEVFKTTVSSGRGDKIKEVDALFNGEWWSAKDSISLGLADRIVDGDIEMAKKTGENQETQVQAATQEVTETVSAQPQADLHNMVSEMAASIQQLGTVVQGLVTKQAEDQNEQVLKQAVSSGVVSEGSLDEARSLLGNVGADAFRQILNLRPQISPHPHAESSGGHGLRDGHMTASSEAAQLQAWGFDPAVVAKYGDAKEIDLHSRTITMRNGREQKSRPRPISAASDNFLVGGIPNAKLKELELQDRMNAFGGEE